MFELKWTKEADGQYKELRAKAQKSEANRKAKNRKKSSKDEGLFKQVQKTIKWLKENPRHSGLQTHEYHSLPHPFKKKDRVFEAYAQSNTPGAYRVFWCYGPDSGEITIIAITPHP
jgi:hypothetical protein